MNYRLEGNFKKMEKSNTYTVSNKQTKHKRKPWNIGNKLNLNSYLYYFCGIAELLETEINLKKD